MHRMVPLTGVAHGNKYAIICILLLYYYSSAESGGQGKRRWKFSRPPPSSLHQPPTVSPEAGIHQVVSSQLFDVLWSEVVTILLPLVIATRDKALKGLYLFFYNLKSLMSS